MSLLQELYDGKVRPAEKIVCNDPDYRTDCRSLAEHKAYLRDKLSPEDRERFDKMDELFLTTSSAYGYTNFVYGIRLGISLMLETLTGGETKFLGK